jgi:hypothetical protein
VSNPTRHQLLVLFVQNEALFELLDDIAFSPALSTVLPLYPLVLEGIGKSDELPMEADVGS